MFESSRCAGPPSRCRCHSHPACATQTPPLHRREAAVAAAGWSKCYNNSMYERTGPVSTGKYHEEVAVTLPRATCSSMSFIAFSPGVVFGSTYLHHISTRCTEAVLNQGVQFSHANFRVDGGGVWRAAAVECVSATEAQRGDCKLGQIGEE